MAVSSLRGDAHRKHASRDKVVRSRIYRRPSRLSQRSRTATRPGPCTLYASADLYVWGVGAQDGFPIAIIGAASRGGRQASKEQVELGKNGPGTVPGKRP